MENSSTHSDKKLIESVKSVTGQSNQLFAVMEGAHFDNIQLELERLKLEFYPLYSGEGDRQNQIAGPHLVVVNDRDQISQIRELGEGKPCTVWWGWPDEGDETTDSIFKHLRSINMVEIPIDRYDAETEKEPENEDQSETQEIEKPEYEPVLFRHADPNVMASILPILNTGQLGRLFGKSAGLTMHASDFGEGDEGLRSTPRPASLPKPHAGFLRITHEQYEEIGKIRLSKMEKSVSDYLKEVAEEECAELSDEELKLLIRQSVHESANYGVFEEANHCRWAYLQLINEGKFSNTNEVRYAMATSDLKISPDERVEALMEETIAALEELS